MSAQPAFARQRPGSVRRTVQVLESNQSPGDSGTKWSELEPSRSTSGCNDGRSGIFSPKQRPIVPKVDVQVRRAKSQGSDRGQRAGMLNKGETPPVTRKY
ncbi:hypothetical protein SARC_15326 [Sphaeroforma arctica JP610]|uniref:Uncharacterized protein n=1 Tax=Sphaeroforma arctica JP610 TaxID=667725 RepID=A0A0L0F5Z0_9EUKA|nr:hypothetical protein SARC_15326 [Sphaeroforma arctica JP610]KNC72125.1 hypothetical protein SARC_15326 [Sphaeroforma arctica JP610]|eukprot:XP_014146027.1 hypothetical protein SARC_15326 [Sphaeroforma arctica JP610]